MSILSKEEFVKYCAESEGCTVEEILKYNEIFPCNCEYQGCKGWRLELKKNALLDFYNSINKNKFMLN